MGLFHTIGKFGRGLWHTVKKEGQSIFSHASKPINKFTQGILHAGEKVAKHAWANISAPFRLLGSAQAFVTSPFGFGTTLIVAAVAGIVILRVVS